MNRLTSTLLLTLGLLTLPALGARAESDIRPAGVRALLGIAVPDDADVGIMIGAVADLGTVFEPWIHLSAGITRWSADLDESLIAGRSGSMSDVHVYTSVGIELPEISEVRPFVTANVGTHFLDASVDGDAGLGDAISGTNFGGGLGAGVSAPAGSFRVSAELRRQWVDDASNWSFAVGLGTDWGRGGEQLPAAERSRR